MSFARKFGDKYGKKSLDTATKTGIDAAKTASKRVVKKTAEATRDLIGNKIANNITSVGKTKSKETEDETNKRQEIYIPPEKRKQIIDNFTLICLKWVPKDPSTISLANSFTQKMPESSDFMCSSNLMLENTSYQHFTLSVPNSQAIENFFQFSSGPRGPTTGKKLPMSCEFGPL